MSTTDSPTDRVIDPATPSGTSKERLDSITMPNGDSPATPPSTNAVSPAVDNSEVTDTRVEEILLSDIGVTTLLTRLKQSIASCRLAGFLKKRATIEEEHAQGLRKLCKLMFESPRRLEGRRGSYMRQVDEMTAIHDRIAEHGIQFSQALHEMYEDLMELAANIERARKHWKITGLSSEKKVHESLLILEKTKGKYDQIAEEYDRARSGDKRARDFKVGRGFARTGAQVEEDLRNRVSTADQEYAKQVQITNVHRQELLGVQRPQAVKALRALIFECDAVLTLQLQKFATLSEKLLLNNGMSVSPIKAPGSTSNAQSMRDVIFMIDNDQDFKKFILSMESKLPAQSKPAEIKYEKNPVLFTGAHSPYTTPSTPSGAPPGSQSGLPGLQREASNHSQTPTQGYGAVIQQPPIIPKPHPGYNPQQFQPPQNNNSGVPELPRDKPVFGVSLDQLLERDGSAVPIVVYQCIKAVDLYGLNVEGIYRIPGTKQHLVKIKNIFDNDSSQVDFRQPEAFFHDVNSVTSVLKSFFRELPDPLLTSALYDQLITASRINDDIVRRDTLHGIINRLPDPNYATFRALILHLNRVQQKSAINRMNSGNLAICFGPTVMGSEDIANTGWQVRVVDTVLQNWDSIFDPDEDPSQLL
ncbi:RhoGAP-domain-containing protein [Terfezia boudieri ATCC MYA-4762]|uniref:RhoGAP-domain-containing protein n=1 Tax=Terfezia boudieri ATCC MYA-4762 TaxID=1051890 RepID=A0A3N4LX53_9PEZI|nr:RhoGAP-domain-containing protein [Terfezia boudieri ATCC MYA-4762]